MTPKTFTVLSETSRDIGQVFFASVFLTPLLSGTLNFFLVYAGPLLSLIFWYLNILLTICVHVSCGLDMIMTGVPAAGLLARKALAFPAAALVEDRWAPAPHGGRSRDVGAPPRGSLRALASEGPPEGE
jgi:hypothetical protein